MANELLPYVKRAQELNDETKIVVESGASLGVFNGFDKEKLRDNLVCAFTFTLSSHELIFARTSQTFINTSVWFCAITDFPLHATLVLSIDKGCLSEEKSVCDILERTNKIRKMMLKFFGTTLNFSELVLDKNGTLSIFGSMPENIRLIRDQIEREVGELNFSIIGHKDFMHTVLARNMSPNTEVQKAFHNDVFLPLKEKIYNFPLELCISEYPYIGPVYPFLSRK